MYWISSFKDRLSQRMAVLCAIEIHGQRHSFFMMASDGGAAMRLLVLICFHADPV